MDSAPLFFSTEPEILSLRSTQTYFCHQHQEPIKRRGNQDAFRQPSCNDIPLSLGRRGAHHRLRRFSVTVCRARSKPTVACRSKRRETASRQLAGYYGTVTEVLHSSLRWEEDGYRTGFNVAGPVGLEPTTSGSAGIRKELVKAFSAS